MSRGRRPRENSWVNRMIAVGVTVAVAAVGADLAATEPSAAEPSVARMWNEELLDAIRIDRPKPPVHARNLFHLSVAMWDAWAAYNPLAVGYITDEFHTAQDIEAAREEAISYAAYRLLRHRFPGGGMDADGQPCQPGAGTSLAAFDARMEELGYDRSFTSTAGDSPAALGNRIGQAVIDYGLTDGANEGVDLCYPDDSGYWSVNPSLVFKLPGTNVLDPNHWQPLAFDFLVLQNGIVIGRALQTFVGVGWADVKPFGLTPDDLADPDPQDCEPAIGAGLPYVAPGCPPQLGGVGDDILKDAIVELIRLNSSVDPDDTFTVDISPSVHGNNPLGTDDGTGHRFNPSTGEPYASNVVKYADWARVMAEFWADGPDSETPPGHWNVLANYVSDALAADGVAKHRRWHWRHSRQGGKRFRGQGKVLNDLEWDVKLYLAMNGAQHDAAIGAWGAKHYYDSSRPITLIRYMGGLGQSSEPSGPSYHPDGLPLVDGLIEVITSETTAPGERHEHLAGHEGEMAIRAWNGHPDDPETETGGVGWIRAVEWMPYQASNFVTPPFPGYISGHSCFSRVGAEVLEGFTGDEYFPGGLGSFVAQQNDYLRFEVGPSETVELQWATFSDAADEAGISRRYGGIHPYYDDLPARLAAATIGKKAFDKAREYYGPSSAWVCHEVGRRGWTISLRVSADAVPRHLAHGDELGRCSDDHRPPWWWWFHWFRWW